jgi:hypothetical protein
MEKELEAAREDICKLKAGNVSSNFMVLDNSGKREGGSPTPDPLGYLQ